MKDASGLGGKKEESDIFKIVRMIAERNFEPCIVFSFSKKECEVLAGQVRASGMGICLCVDGGVG